MKYQCASRSEWTLYFTILFLAAGLLCCGTVEEDPALVESRKLLIEMLGYIPHQTVNKDSLLIVSKELSLEQHQSLVSDMEKQYRDVISEGKVMKEREQKIRAQFDLKEGFHIKTKYAVQESMDDPDSFTHEATTYLDKGDTIYVSMKFKMREPSGTIRSYLIESKVDIDGNVLVGDLTRLNN